MTSYLNFSLFTRRCVLQIMWNSATIHGDTFFLDSVILSTNSTATLMRKEETFLYFCSPFSPKLSSTLIFNFRFLRCSPFDEYKLWKKQVERGKNNTNYSTPAFYTDIFLKKHNIVDLIYCGSVVIGIIILSSHFPTKT